MEKEFNNPDLVSMVSVYVPDSVSPVTVITPSFSEPCNSGAAASVSTVSVGEMEHRNL